MTANIRRISTSPQEQWVEKEVSAPASGREVLGVSSRYLQEWEGFGGCFNELGWKAVSVLNESDKNQVLDALFAPEADGCRLSYCRLPIGASDYGETWYSHNEHDGDYAMEKFSIARDYLFLLPYIREAQKRRDDLTLFASPWSPPSWMKHPKSYNYGTLVWTPENLRAYALYFSKFVQAYENEGVSIAQVHVQNEPNSDQKFPSCLWTGEKMRDFIRDYLGPQFERDGLKTEIWAGTIERGDYNLGEKKNEGFNQWANVILMDEAARKYISGVGYQWAGKMAVGRTHQAWPEMRLAQTENECGDGRNSWEYAGHVFDMIHHYISNGVNAYVYWNMVLEPGGLSTWGWNQNSMICVDAQSKAVVYNPEFYVMKHFARFVKPGARVVKLSGHWAGNALAFENPGGETVVVVRNPFDKAYSFVVEKGEDKAEITLEAEEISTLVFGA